MRSNNPGADFLVIGAKAFSTADQFELLTHALGQLIAKGEIRFPVAASGMLGPDTIPPPVRAKFRCDWPAFRAAVLDTWDYLNTHRRIPARVFIGPDAVSPVAFMAA